MQLRELLNNQQVLAPLVSAKPMGQENSLNAFNQILTEKTNDSAPKRNMNNQRPEQTSPLRREGIAVGSRNETPQFEPVKSSEQNVEKKETTHSKEDKSKKNVSEPKENGESEKIKKLIKERLKKNTGLNDQEIDVMISSFMAEPSKILEFFDSNDAFVSALSDLIVGLELNEVLHEEMSTKDMQQLLHQLERLIDSLTKHSVERDDSNQHADKEQGKAFDMKVVNSLSRLASELKNMDVEENDIKPNEIRKMVVEALIRPEQQPVKGELAKTETEVETDLPLVNLSSDLKKTQTENMLRTNTSERIQDSNIIKSDDVTLATLKTNESIVQAVHVEDAGASTEESGKGAFAHQIMMKQGNMTTTQTVQTSPAQRQEIFTQIMDAIKGHIKLSDDGTTMLIKLQPEQLGNVELKLNLHKGIVLAEIKVENEMVKAAIESNLDDLKQSLSNKGYAIDQLNVSVDSGKKNRQEAFGGSRKNKASEKNDKNESVETVGSINRYVADEYEGSTINYYG